MGPLLLRALLLLLLQRIALNYGSRYQTVGHENEKQFIQLKSQFDINPSSTLVLPIQVTPNPVGLNGLLPPRLVSINSFSSDGTYGPGDQLEIVLTFISNVWVLGNPTLTLNTGCHDDSCKVVEIQAFVCRADLGMFGLRLGDEFVMNINVNTTKEQFQNLLQQLPQIQNVSVAYSETSPSNLYSPVNRICTSKGNNVTLMFQNVSFPEFDGDVPALEFDVTNGYEDPRTDLSLGDGDYLRGVHASYDPSIVSDTLVQGAQQRDGSAFYSAGNGTTIITFLYTVRSGDSTGSATLVVKSINFDTGSIVSPITLQAVSTVIPDFRQGKRFMIDDSNSLGVSRAIFISTASPSIVAVTSTLPDGVYTLGDVIPILLMYDLPVKVVNGVGNMIVVLSTGQSSNPLLFNRRAIFIEAVNSTALLFEYTVGVGDVSPRLDVVNSNSLMLGGASIYLDNSTNDTNVSITLPSPGTEGSLSFLKNIIINTQAPLITSISVYSENGTYTAGDSIYIDVTYSSPIVVIGEPILWLTNPILPLNVTIIDAPAYPTFAYGRALPGFASQLVMAFSLNWNLHVGDIIAVSLSGFSIPTTSLPNSSLPLSLAVSGPSNISVAASWISSNSSLQLTMLSFIPSNMTLTLALFCAAGLRVPLDGISNQLNTPTFTVYSLSLEGGVTLSLPFSPGYGVGILDAEAVLTPLMNGSVSLLLTFSFPEYLSIGDSLVVSMPGFTANSSAFPSYASSGSLFSVQWTGSNSTLLITLTSSISPPTLVVALDNTLAIMYPSTGVDSDTLSYGFTSLANGAIPSMLFDSISHICGFLALNLSYLDSLPSSVSSLEITFTLSGTSLNQGDLLVFILGGYPTSSGSIIGLESTSIDAALFNMTLSNGIFTLQALQALNYSSPFSLLFGSDQGFAVPANGISLSDKVFAQIFSASCEMPAAQIFTYGRLIASVQSPLITITSSDPSANMAVGVAINLTLSFDYSYNFTMSDELTLQIPYLYRNPLLLHEVNITSILPISCIYDLFHTSLIMTFFGNFTSLSALNAPLNVTFSADAGLSISNEGLPSDSMYLSIESLMGSMGPLRLSTPCIGFCDTSISYSTIFANEPLVISALSNLSIFIPFGTVAVLDLTTYQPMASGLILTALNNSFIVPLNVIFTLISLSPLSVNFTMPFDLIAFSNFSITISGLSFIQGSADILGPRLSFQGTRLNMNGSLFTTFSPPNAVFDVPLVVNTSLFFGNLTAGGPSEVTISLVAIDALANSSEIRLTLPNFILTTTLNQIVSLSSSALITYVANSSSVSGITLEILLLQSVSANSVFTCSIIGLSLPVQGLTRLTLPSLDFPSFSFILSAIIISPPTPIVVFNDVTAIYQSIVSFITSSGRSLSSIGLSFIFNSNLSMGDSLSVYLPLLESQSISYFLMTTLLFNASWSAGMFTLDLTLLQPLPTGLINLTIPATNGTFPLSLPMQGYYSTEAIIGSITIQQMSLGRITTSALALPCYGVCSASATVGTPRAGYASSFFFSIVFGGQAFTSGDSLSFTLTGFDTIPLTGSVLTSNSNSISVSWNVSTSILLVVALSPFPLSEMLNFSLPADQVLALPLSGIRPVNAFNVTWISGAASLITQAPVLTFQNVGAVLQSSLLISPLVPGKVSQFNISLQLVDELQAGDVWLIGLPGYTIPSGDIPDLQCNFNVSAAAVFGTLNTFTLRINQMIPALSIVNVFVPLSAGFVLSILGFGLGGALPFMSIASSTSPIANTNFITFSSVGSMFPSSFTAQGSMLYFNFTLQCSLEAGSKIVVSLPNIVGPDETIPSSNSYSPLAISSGLWLGSTQTIEFFVVTTIPANILLEITAQTFSLAYSNAIYYTDDYRFTFSIQSSPLCAMDSTSFDSSSSSLLSYSFVAFSTPIVSRNTNIIFNLTADFAILKNDMIFVSFPYFASLNSSLVNPPINTTSSLFVISGASIDMNGTFSLNLTAQALIPSDTMISITLISSVFIVPPTGVLSSSFYPLAIIRASSSGGNILLAHGSFASVQPVGYFVLKTVQVLNPVPGMATGLLISWEIGADSSTGDVVVLRLPGFLCSNLSYTGAIPFSSSAPAGLSITWIPLMNEMQISFLRAYSTQVFKVSIPLEAGFLAPSYGISGPMGTYMIELLSTSFPVLWTDLDSISIVPIALAELSFLSCEAAEAYESTGDFFSIFLAAGHGLNSGDAGALIQIQDQIYQIGASTSNSVYLSSDENIMALTRAFNGSTVFDGLPATQIFTSPIRPAIYFGGNNSATIRFSYFIRRGDSSDGIQVLNTASSFFVSSNPDLNGGHLYRASMQPSLDSRQVIPSFPFVNTGLIIDTSRPVITAFTTTSPVGTYAEGEMLDLSVQFNLPVAIKNGSYGAPSLLIHVNPYSYGVAIYVAGSGSNTLTFAYQVIIQNLVTSVNASLITTSFPVIQPLRAISNNYYGYIRRDSPVPLVDAQLSFPANLSYAAFSNISLMGIAPRVVSLSSNYLSSRGDSLSAGDSIFVYVQYSQSIRITLSQNLTNLPYLLLETGTSSSSPGIALFFNQSAVDTLIFKYVIRSDDVIDNGLYLYCSCRDFFNRSFLELGDEGNFISSNASSSLMASLVLAPNASLASRLVSAGFYIDNLASEVVSFSSNVTNGVYSPGSSITIYILFSSPVSVVSYTILALHGDNASCSARYYGGNNTASLSFLYQTSESSGTCRLEYLNAGSLQGSILRFSEAPTLRANLQLELPGTRFSLGMTTRIIIDPSAARILQISVSSVATSRGILVMDSLAISTNNVDSTSIAFRMAQELFALPFNASSPLADIEAIITPTLPSPLQIMEDGFANIIIYNTVEHSLMSSPLWVDIISNRGQGGLEAQLQSYWWSSYTLSNVVDLILLTDREVLATDSYFTLTHSSNLNQARLTSAAQNYTLTVYKGSNDDLVDQYQLEYGGYLTQCVSSNAGSSGFMSLEAALEEIIPLRRLGITVHVILNSPMVLIYNIQLLRPASYPLRVILDNGMCPLAMPTSSVLMTSTVQLTYRYLIRDVTSLILTPNSFIPPGNYSIILGSNNGLYLSNFGVEANSIRYEYALNVAEGKLLSMIITNPAIPRLIATSVQFSALTPNTSTAIVASICFETGFQTGDMINITLPNFIGSSSSFTSSGSAFIMNVVNSTMDSSIHLVIIFLTNSTCFNMEMDESFGILTPLQAVYTIDSPFFVFSYLGTAGALANQPFNSVSTVAFASFDLTLGFPTYSSATSVSVQFQLVATFQASNGYISVVLPGFTSASSLDIYNLQIEGPFQYSLTVDWIQATNTLLITSLYDLDPFLCNFTIPLLSSQTLVVSPDGISELNPPTVAVSSVGWSMVATPLSYYPPVVGLLTATLNITVSRPLLELESVQIVAIFTRVLQGPATISVFLPDVYSVNGSTLLSFSTYNGTCVWHDWLHTLTLTLDSSWSGNTIILNLFNMSSLMSPGLNMRDSFTTTLLNSTIAFNASNAFLLPSSFTMVVPVPVIITSAITFSSALFATNSIITVSASLNALAFPGDTLSFLLYGLNGQNARNLTVSGICCDSAFAVFDNSTGLFTSRVAFFPECISGQSRLNWTIRSPFGLPYPQTVMQLGTNVYQISWTSSSNGNSSTGLVPFSSNPIIGILSSSIAFDVQPLSLSLGISAVYIKVITMMTMNINDAFVFILPQFQSTMTETTVLDSQSNSWTAVWDQSSFTLKLITSRAFSPAFALNLTIPATLSFQLPPLGVAADCDCLLVAMQISGKLLAGQSIQQVQNVGAILALTLQAIAQSPYSSNNDNPLLIRSFTTLHRDVLFRLNMTLSQPLNAGDEIHIYAPSYTFFYNDSLTLQGLDSASFTGECDSRGKRMIFRTETSLSSTVLFSVLPTDAIGVPLLYCNQFNAECPMYVTILSSTCPVNGYPTLADCSYFFPFSFISLRNIEQYYPPSGQPTGQPSSQPSVQPSGQPTAHPSSLISFRPTMTPSQLPTLLPTVYPTFLPSIAPSVVPTLPPALLNASSSMPSGQPSSQPTFSPTNNAFPPYLLQIDILYDMQTSLPIKSIIAVFIPQIQSTSNINDTLVLGNQSTYWSSFWNASLQSLELTTLQNLTPGVQSLTILSSNLLLANTLLYENDSSLSYTITSSACFVNGGEFDKVQANGLRSSSLSFTNFTDFNSPIGLHIQFIAEDELLPGDSLVVLLPNFTSSTVGTLLLEAGSDTGARIAWKPSLSGIKIFINTPLMQLNIIVSVLNNITLPLTGSSVLTGLPKISLRTRNIFYYSLTPFLSFKPITVLSFASLSFNSPAIAGQEAIVYIVFNFSPAIVAYDSFSFYLPSLWTSAEGVALLTNTSVGFRLSWSSCSNMLQLTASLGVPGGSFNLSILGLRLPVDGLGLDLSQIFTVSSNASNGMILPTPFNTVQLVGFFLESNLSILNPALSGSPVSFQLVFRASFSLKPNESVMVLIPGVTATDPLLSFGLNTSGFTVTWDAVASTVVFTSLFPIEANTSITISCNSSLILPLEGFPPPNSSTLISSDASEGPVDPSNLSHVDAVGLEASVHYLIDDLKDYVGIRFEILTFSFFIGLGDTIVITTPLVSGVASSSSNVSAFGSFAENGFAPIFDVTFDPILSNFILVATQSISSHRMNVFVSRSNQFILNLATAGIVSQHQVRGTFASLGVMSKRDINFTPLSLRNYSNNAVTASFLACNYVDSCSLLMNLQLGNGLIAGESILIGHASFMFPSLSSGAANLTITGIDSELFDVSIRTADNIEAISIDPSMQYNGGAPIATTLADVSYHPFNSTLPETVLPVSVYTTLPRIYGSIMETNLVSLSCGDSIAITLLFTQQVQVYQPSGLLLQLNTQESAYYLNGSGSMALSFIYRVSSPLEVAFLSTNGANALLLTQGANITNAFQSNMAANTTLPFPFAIMNSVTGQPALMGVNCSSSISTILSVEVYGIPSTSVLATGDVLNVAVQFNRAITVVGVPSLLLSGDFNATYIAVYRNVSLVQLLDVVGPGMYTLGYEDENTYCIAWNDTLGLAAALQTLPSLQDALPVVITSFVTTGALRYRLEFTGQPPFVLTASRVLCDVTATARVSLDPNMLSVAVFSYTVLSGDAAAHVSYPNSSSLLLDTVNRIYLGDIIRQTPVVGLLPIPGAVNSLFATSNISIRTQSPLVVNVFSNFSSSLNLSYAITGDIIPIYIRFSNAITVIGNPSLLLNVSSLLKPVNSYTPQAEFVTAVDDVLVLQYIVMSGDLAFPLKVLNNASLLLLNGSEILLRSLHPQTLANITLPAPVSTNSLFNSSIFVNASGASSLLSISCDQPPGLYGAGVTLILNLNLFSPVNLLSSNLSSPLSNTPSIILAAPFEAVIQYINGSGTSSLAFSFLIQFGDNANHILFSPVGFSFSIQLLNGYFSDNLGNIWNEFLIPPRYDYLDGVVVDTSPPFVLFVNTSNSNGTYFPGELIDIIVVFSKPVAVTGVPQIELFVPYEDIPQKLATYSFGSGSYELHFLFLVPPADSHFSFHPDVPLDYASDSSLFVHMGNATIIEANGYVPADLLLPVKDKSYVRYNRSLFLSFDTPHVLRVKALNPDGVYTAGDVISIECLFSAAVMVFYPPVLRLQVNIENRNAIFVSGNNSNTILFNFLIQPGDFSPRLDYVDTRLPPFSMTAYPANSLALNTDILGGSKERLQALYALQFNSIFIVPTVYGGVFTSSANTSSSSLTAANTFLPLPGDVNSISFLSNINIDTTAPVVVKVFSVAPTGAYDEHIALSIVVRFNVPVVVGQCPFLVFQLNRIDRDAIYISGSGTTDLLFQFQILLTDTKIGIDYADVFALRLSLCNPDDVRQDLSSMFIKRASMNPTIPANLTLPPIYSRLTVISPTSITGGGQNITLAGGTTHPKEVYSKYGFMNTTYSVGDIIDIRVMFTGPVSVSSSSALSFMLSNLSHPAYFAGTVNSTVIAFIFVVLPGDNTSLLTYSDTFSLRTLTSCALMDTVLNSCAAQNLPPPFSSSLNAMDLLSPLMMKILPYEGSFSSTMNLAPSLSSIPVIVNIEFVYPSSWQSFFTTGDLLQVLVTFSDAVAVIGTPYLQLFMDDMPLNLFFRDQPTRLALAFAYPIQSASLFGELLCSNLSSIILNGGRIVSAFNFIAIQDADIRIQPVCCATGICSLSSNILTEALIALRVYAGQSGVYSFPSSIDIYIDFNRPVVVIGQPVLLLSLPTNGTAVYIQNVNSNTLHFVYDLLPEDFTSDLDYASYPSLYCNEDDEGQCGIQLADTFYAFPASFLLPHSGEAGSLGRQSDVVIAMNIPILLTLNVTPSIAVLGDVIYFTFIYSDNLIGALSNNNSILPASANLSSYLSLAFAVVPSLEINSTFPFLNNETVAPAFTASFDSLANNSIVFSYEVSLEDPNGFVVFVSSAPIQYMEGIELVSYKYLTQASNILPATLVNQPLATIDNIVPYVILVDSPTVESSSFPFGVGSTLVILVHFSAPVVSFDTPVLRLRFSDGRTALAYGVGINSTSPTYAVQFDYIIDVGDNANPLDYDGIHALSGDIRRYSLRDSLLPANLTLPPSLTFSSLADTSNIVIDTNPPYVVAMFAANKPGEYGLNESILVVVRFSKPVVVTGNPTLTLQVTDTSTAVATLKVEVSNDEVRIELLSTDIVFEYFVQEGDTIPMIHHSGPNALFLPNGSAILQLTSFPSLPADILLRDFTDMSTSYGKIERQWMSNFPHKVEVLLRDLHHTAPASLTALIEHNGAFAEIFDAPCPGKVFGVTYPGSRLGNNATAIQPDADIGFDYFFSDSRASNLALFGIVRQSSTLDNYTASLAVDGNRDPYLADMSVSSTLQELQPWWLLQLPSGSSVRTISITPRSAESWSPPVLSFTVKQLTVFPRGFFKLTFADINLFDPSINTTTPFISFGANATELANILEATPGLGSVLVTLKVIQMCGTIVLYRCSDDSEFGFGYKYTIQLLDILTAEPTIAIVELTPLGGDVIGGATNETTDVLSILLITSSEIVTRGHPIPRDENPSYPRGVTENSMSDFMSAGRGYNEWLTPCWVMLFNDTKVQPPSDLEASRNTSIWIQYFNSSQDLEQIVFPQAIAVGFLKVQLDIFGSLSLAEVEIYSSKMNSLRYYDRGSPVVSSTITKPYQADQPLDSTFKYVDFTGLWHLQIQQKSDTSSLDVPGGWEGAYGTISDFVIIITDLSGTVFTFYQDLVAEITSLPNHGSLYVTSRDNSSFWDFQEAFQMDPEYRIGTREGSGLPLGLCYKDPGCLSKSGKGPLLDFRHLLGATPSLNFLRDERVVVYVPDAGFLGSDSLTYVVHQGTQLQQHVSFNGQSGSLNEVTMNIRNCRRYQQETVNGYTTSPQALCSCAFNSTVTSAAISSCGAAVLSMCSSTDLSSNVFVNMCESCGLSIAQMTLNMSSQTSGACSTEIYRAVWFVLDRGICSANPRRDCISESFTESGRDVRNYLSLKPPLLYGSISALGNSFGGYGWFDTAVLDSS